MAARLSARRTFGVAIAAGATIAGCLVVVLALTGGEAKAGVELRADGTVVAPSLSPKDAISQAEAKVGYPVRVPASVAPGLVLSSVRAEVGPVEPDQNGVPRDLSFVRSVTLHYTDGKGRLVEIDQLPPGRNISGPPGSRAIDAGAQGVTALAYDGNQMTYVAWNSATASYLARYHDDNNSAATSDIEQLLLATLKSMK